MILYLYSRSVGRNHLQLTLHFVKLLALKIPTFLLTIYNFLPEPSVGSRSWLHRFSSKSDPDPLAKILVASSVNSRMKSSESNRCFYCTLYVQCVYIVQYSICIYNRYSLQINKMLSDIRYVKKSSIEGTMTKIWCKQTGYEDYRTFVNQMFFQGFCK